MNRRRFAFFAAAVLVSLATGFVLCAHDIISWDDLGQLQLSRYLLSQFHLIPGPVDVSWSLRWYGPLWEFCLGIGTEFLFGFLKDPIWVRHALTFALFPMTLILVPALLVRGGVRSSTAVLAACFLFGMIRLGGHAAVNVKDFPFACAYLLASLYLWILLRDGHMRSGGRGYATAELAWMGLVALIPYLLRPPALMHLPLLMLFLSFYYAFVARDSRWKAVAVPAGLGAMALAVVAAAFFPGLREGGWRAWAASLQWLSRFPWTAPVRAFGRVIPTGRTPRWYLFVWIPVILHPFVLVGAAAGLIMTAAGAGNTGHPFPLKMRRFEWNLSLRLWLGAIIVLTWGALLTRMPVLYDEERHILFLYPPLLVLAALGLDQIDERLKRLLGGLIVAGSLVSYAAWGRYSYVYKSPLIGASASEGFMGDYWGLCVPLAVRALQGRVPAGTDVLVDGPLDVAVLEERKLTESAFGKVSGFGSYRFRTDGVFSPPFAAIFINRFGQHMDYLARDAAFSRVLWTGSMPPGEPACVLAVYPGRR